MSFPRDTALGSAHGGFMQTEQLIWQRRTSAQAPRATGRRSGRVYPDSCAYGCAPRLLAGAVLAGCHHTTGRTASSLWARWSWRGADGQGRNQKFRY